MSKARVVSSKKQLQLACEINEFQKNTNFADHLGIKLQIQDCLELFLAIHTLNTPTLYTLL